MKHFKQVVVLFLAVALAIVSCKKDDDPVVVPEVKAPTNVEATVDVTMDNTGVVSVSPTGEGASKFQIYFGDVEGETATEVDPGQSVSHTYTTTGDFTIRIVAVGSTGLMTEITKPITITLDAPALEGLSLPITFELANADYTFETFGDATTAVVDNANSMGENTSAKVGQFTKPSGAQVWAGTFLTMENPIDFSLGKTFKMKVFSPKTGAIIKLKLENLTDGDIFLEVDAVSTVANDWEELAFDFSAIDEASTYQKVVVFFDFDAMGDDSVYSFDDIEQSMDTVVVSTMPTVGADAPEEAAGSVISLFSNAYTNVSVDTWITEWSDATLEDIMVAGNDIKKYSALSFVGIETTSAPIDATNMTNFRTDIWTADATELKIKLVDFGADGAFDGGDDVEHELTIAAPAQNQWVSIDLPLENFAGLTTRAHIAQLIYAGAPSAENTVYIDNVYFYDSGQTTGVAAPTAAAPVPTVAEANVISMFSDVYTDVAVDTWLTDWSDAALEDITIEGNATKKYGALSFVGIETTSAPIDATTMTHFHTDIWTADATEFKIKLVDFGANGTFDGAGMGDDVEHEITIAAPAQGEWVSLDIPLSDFVGLTTKGNIAQLIYVGAPAQANTVYVDNVYFHN